MPFGPQDSRPVLQASLRSRVQHATCAAEHSNAVTVPKQPWNPNHEKVWRWSAGSRGFSKRDSGRCRGGSAGICALLFERGLWKGLSSFARGGFLLLLQQEWLVFA